MSHPDRYGCSVQISIRPFIPGANNNGDILREMPKSLSVIKQANLSKMNSRQLSPDLKRIKQQRMIEAQK